ncbi:MAG: ABC transporter ATP-binding protein, partial [Pseudomonadota bacterium]
MTVPLSQTARFFLTRWRNTGWMAAGAIGFTLAASVGEVIVPLIVGALVQDLADGVHGNLLVWIAVFAGLRWAIAGLRYGAHRNYGLATTKAMREIAEEAFDRVLRLPSAWFARTHSAATVRGLTRGVWAFEDLSDEVLVDLAPTAFVILASLVVVLVKWPLLGLGLAVAVMAIVAAGAVLLFAVLGPARRRAMAADTEVAVSFSDAVTCNDLVKQAGAEAREAKRFAGAVGLWAERLRLTWLLTALVELGQSTILTLIVGGTLLGLIWLDPAVGPGEIAFFVTLAIVLEGHLRDVGLHLRLAQRAISEMESMVALLGEVAETDLPGKGIQRPRDGRIEMRGVRFRYPGAATLVYRGLDLTIADGERVAVVGASGAGKTTLIRLLTRCYDVEAGEIRLG